MQQLSDALQSAQQSLQQAGQQTAQGESGEAEATEAEMGQEFGASGDGGQSDSSSQPSDRSRNRSRGGGMGRAGRGSGGHAGAQQPLPGAKKDALVRGRVNDRGQKLVRSYRGTPDPTQDRAAYYAIVPDRLRAAESSLNREEIPRGYKKQVKDYFEAIQPR